MTTTAMLRRGKSSYLRGFLDYNQIDSGAETSDNTGAFVYTSLALETRMRQNREQFIAAG
jgi:hypothetical protein